MTLKYYLADILTLIRFILAGILITMAFTPGSSFAAAFSIFVIGEITDALDGTLSITFPFPKNHTPKYRKYASLYDMLADVILAAAMALFFIMQVSVRIGLTIGIVYAVCAVLVDFLIYGRLLGHPDTAKPNSLMVKNFKLAKAIILTRRYLYVGLVILAAIAVLYLSEWPLAVKIIINTLGVTILLVLFKFIRQRALNISRDAVDIEQKLESKQK